MEVPHPSQLQKAWALSSMLKESWLQVCLTVSCPEDLPSKELHLTAALVEKLTFHPVVFHQYNIPEQQNTPAPWLAPNTLTVWRRCEWDHSPQLRGTQCPAGQPCRGLHTHTSCVQTLKNAAEPRALLCLVLPTRTSELLLHSSHESMGLEPNSAMLANGTSANSAENNGNPV